MTTLAGLAIQTERVRLGTLMTASTYRRPGPLAITVATVDGMSGGRPELGIGAAWIEQEHRYLGIPFPPLGERFDRLGEQLEIITGLWSTPPGSGSASTASTTSWRSAPASRGPRGGRRSSSAAPGRGARPRWPRGSPTSSTAACRTGWPLGSRTSGGSASSPAGIRPRSGCPPRCRCAAGNPRRGRPPGRHPGRGRRPDADHGRHRHPGDIIGRLAELHAAGANTVHFHLDDVTDLDHVRLLGAEVLPQLA